MNMKAMKYFLTAALAVLATGASAQFTNSSSSSSSEGKTYNRLYVSYNPQTIDELDLTGFTVGYTSGISVLNSKAVSVEFGARLNYSFKNEDIEYTYNKKTETIGETKYKYMNIAVPVNVAYKLTAPNGKLSFTPYLGLTFKYNIMGTTKEEYNDEYSQSNKDSKTNWFDKDDMGGAKWKRFQVGWQVGAGLSYNALYVGFHYGGDFGNIISGASTTNWGVSLGVNF